MATGQFFGGALKLQHRASEVEKEENVQLLIIMFSMIVFLILCYPLLLRNIEFSDKVYRIKKAYAGMRESGENWNHFIKLISPKMNAGIVTKFDSFLRVAGRPGNRSAVELLILYSGTAIGLSLVATQLQEAKVEMVILALLFPAVQINRLNKKRLRRKMEAEEATRVMKRQLILMLQQKIPIVEALEMLSKDEPGTFGETFRNYMRSVSDREISLRTAMKEFRQDFEAQALTEMCLAIELSDEKSLETLADTIHRQTVDENKRIDDLLSNKNDATKNSMYVVVAVAAVWSVVGALYFGWFGFKDYFQGAGGFLFF